MGTTKKANGAEEDAYDEWHRVNAISEAMCELFKDHLRLMGSETIYGEPSTREFCNYFKQLLEWGNALVSLGEYNDEVFRRAENRERRKKLKL